MTIDDQRRLHLHRRLEETLGPDGAATMMASLPPAGWEEVASTSDLEHLDERWDGRFRAIDYRFEVMEGRLDGLERRLDGLERRLDGMDRRFDSMDGKMDGFHRELRTMMLAMIATIVSVGGVLVAAIKL